MRRAIGLATTEPSKPPTAPAPSTSPSVPGDTSSACVAYSTNNAQKTKLKKLIVAVARSVARTTSDAAIQRSPTVTPRSFSSGGGSAGRIRPRSAPEPRNETASSRSAPGAVTACVRNPAIVGPATKENARLPFSSELASTKRSRGTIVWKSDASATPKSTVIAPARNATT